MQKIAPCFSGGLSYSKIHGLLVIRITNNQIYWNSNIQEAGDTLYILVFWVQGFKRPIWRLFKLSVLPGLTNRVARSAFFLLEQADSAQFKMFGSQKRGKEFLHMIFGLMDSSKSILNLLEQQGCHILTTVLPDLLFFLLLLPKCIIQKVFQLRKCDKDFLFRGFGVRGSHKTE